MLTRLRVLCAAAVLACAAGGPAAVQAAPPVQAAVEAHLGQPAPALELLDTTQRPRRLSEFTGKPVVLEWTSPSCPFAAAQYESGRMQRLQKWAAGKGVVWLTVLSAHPSRSDYVDAAGADQLSRARGAMPTAVLLDPTGAVGHRYGVLTANHMFVIDRAGKLVYAGGVDDAQSTKADEVKLARNYVRAALEDVLARRKVAQSESEPAGCAISYEGT